MNVRARFFSYFKDFTGAGSVERTLSEGGTVSDLLDALGREFPRLRDARKCALAAVGVDYVPRDHKLSDGDEVSFFPPVQGG